VFVFSFQKYAESIAEETTTMADENIVVAKVNSVVESTQTWIINEKEKTIEYQKKSWADGKLQLQNTWFKLTSWIK
jgi:hypothetical protein